MKKYDFNLETVLSIRTNIEKEWEAKLGKANGDCQVIINRINTIKDELNNSRKSILDISQIEIKSIYEQRLNYQIKQEKEALKRKEEIRDSIKKVYLEKSIDRKVIEKLKEKSLKRYHKSVIKEENLFIDEINNASKIREIMLGGAV
ncbi:MAG: flagellar FliJ family protein [Spirochaetales bacterium]|nr:flagellar FliJ family protein [Spirochaetales bacterium]